MGVYEYRVKLLTTRHFTLGTGKMTKVADNSAQPAFLLGMAGNGIGIGWIWMGMVGTGIGNGWIWMGMVGTGIGNDRNLQAMAGNWKGNNREMERERMVNLNE